MTPEQRKLFNTEEDRRVERALVDAGYMPLSEYVRRWGNEGKEALSSRARAHQQFSENMDKIIELATQMPDYRTFKVFDTSDNVIELHPSEWRDVTRQVTDAGECENN